MGMFDLIFSITGIQKSDDISKNKYIEQLVDITVPSDIWGIDISVTFSDFVQHLSADVPNRQSLNKITNNMISDIERMVAAATIHN